MFSNASTFAATSRWARNTASRGGSAAAWVSRNNTGETTRQTRCAGAARCGPRRDRIRRTSTAGRRTPTRTPRRAPRRGAHRDGSVARVITTQAVRGALSTPNARDRSSDNGGGGMVGTLHHGIWQSKHGSIVTASMVYVTPGSNQSDTPRSDNPRRWRRRRRLLRVRRG
jgi:hypothetical protein